MPPRLKWPPVHPPQTPVFRNVCEHNGIIIAKIQMPVQQVYSLENGELKTDVLQTVSNDTCGATEKPPVEAVSIVYNKSKAKQ